MEGTIRRFFEWAKLKIKIHFSEKEVYFREGEIWWASLGLNIGFEINGKSEDFERPILIIKKFNQYVVWAVPLSTKNKPDNKYYFRYEFGKNTYSAIISQLKLMSSKRLLRKIGIFPFASYVQIRKEIKKLI